MPSGRSGGGHFGGGSRSFSGGHFGGSRSRSSHSGGHFGGSRSFGGSRAHIPSMRWRPHTTVIFGRPVYFGAGRAKAVSLLSILITIAIVAAVMLGLGWYSQEEDLKVIREDYAYYQAMAQYAADNDAYQTTGEVYDFEQYELGGKCCIFYRFDTSSGNTVEGYSFYVYNIEDVEYMLDNGVTLAISSKNTNITMSTDSIPLDYKDMALRDDAEYLDYAEQRDTMRLATIAVGVGAVVMILISAAVSVTAKKATKEQIEETAQAKSGTQNNQQNKTETPAGAWRCAYCNTLNDSSKEQCDGCGASR
ncbi:MAG: hypothetical protein J6B20_01435 [Clostridia bacterium]|nr:hypothetical protein [Clostridia bacterium]